MRRAALLVGWLVLAGVAQAHPLNWTRVEVVVGRSEIELRAEVDLAPAFGGYPGYLAVTRLPPEAVEQRLRPAVDEFLQGLRIGAAGGSGEVVVEEAILPPGGDEEFLDPLAAPMTFVRARVRRAEGTEALEVAVQPGFRFDQPVVLTVKDAGGRVAATGLRMAGAAPLRLEAAIEAPGATAESGAERQRAPEGAGLVARIMRDFAVIGFLHIIPRGWDHVLFVLGLFLLSPRWKPLLWQVSAFTAAHTVTLGLAAAGWVSVPARIVEPLIALSIAWVAVENIARRGELHASRMAVVFGFGLLHGLGFAGVLGGIGLPPGRFGTALVAFNVGVEMGQLAVLALAFAACGWWRERPWYRSRVTVPTSAAIAAVATFWTIQRLAG